MDETEKYVFLKEIVNEENAIEELLLYSKNKFNLEHTNSVQWKETYIDTWAVYCEEAHEIGAFNTLKKYLVQLQFPVEKGISKTEDYINSTLRGRDNQSLEGLQLNQPELIKLNLYENDMIGQVPVLIIPNDDDFDTLICALTNKNEPQELPKSMGASFINGINNWDRIHRLKLNWLKTTPNGNWSEEFKKHILPKPYLYKDKLIVLSTKPYSGISNDVIGVSKSEWMSSSLMIRLEHECAHVFTLKNYGCIANNMHDEIIADYTGITKVLGHFNKDWFLHFVGLENYPNYRKGARLENYKGQNELSDEAFQGLKTIVKNVADSILEFDNALGKIRSSNDRSNRIKSICEVDLLTMASSKGTQKLTETYNRKKLATAL